MRIPLLFTFIVACASSPSEQAAQEYSFGEACGLLPQPCVGWPTSGLVFPDDPGGVTRCSAYCGVYAYCPSYPDREIIYCEAHPHEVSKRCAFGLPDSRMNCHAGLVATEPAGSAK